MAHFEILIEDLSGKKAMDILIPKMLGKETTYRIHEYHGIGHTPKQLKPKTDARTKKLLNDLPRMLSGYGRVPHSGTVVVICDLDNKDEQQFVLELNGILDSCEHKPQALFCVAVEEFEAWYLGDLDAIKSAYPDAKDSVLKGYENDSICGTWELLADAVYKGGHTDLSKKGHIAIGIQKSIWAEEISPMMTVDSNESPSFNKMYMQLKNVVASE